MLLNRRVFQVVCVAAGLGLASCVINQPPTPPNQPQSPPTEAGPKVRGALSGAKQQIAEFYFVNPDCTSGGYPTLKVAKQPQHGQISIEQGTAYAEFTRDKAFAACNGKKVPATLVYYTSEPGFVGSDEVALDRIGVLGAYGYHDYTINVR